MKKVLNKEVAKETFAKAGKGAAKALASRGIKPSKTASPKTKASFTKNFKVSKSGNSIEPR